MELVGMSQRVAPTAPHPPSPSPTAGGEGEGSEGSESEITTISGLDRNLSEQIKTRTISRDYQFIHQSDFVVVIYPTDKLSPGVLSEMNFASRYNKPVYAVYSHARSLFFENLCEQIFDTVEELEVFLRNKLKSET
jgi:hypothetical protein